MCNKRKKKPLPAVGVKLEHRTYEVRSNNLDDEEEFDHVDASFRNTR